jgi:hypothetical protein
VPRSISSGSSAAQRGCAFQQRVRKRQPEGGFVGRGSSPERMIRPPSPRPSRSGVGRADKSACVYGCEGRSRTSAWSPTSTILPRYITAVGGERGPHVLGVGVVGAGGERDEVAEQDRNDLAFLGLGPRGLVQGVAQAPQNLKPSGFSVPQLGQTSTTPPVRWIPPLKG